MMQNSYQFQQKGKNGCFSVLSRATPSVKEIWYWSNSAPRLKIEVRTGIWTPDLLHPKQESYH